MERKSASSLSRLARPGAHARSAESGVSPAIEDCAHTGPGTPAGGWLRRFWQPVYHSSDLKPGRAVPLRIMSQEFTLYRSGDGEVALVGARCPHRGTMLSSGWVEGDALRCFYHGWKFAGDGRCVEQPAEESSFIQKISIPSWPAREYLGFIFAYLGEGPPPELPRYPTFERFAGLVEVDSYLRECNYCQNIDNALDTSHVGFVHGDNRGAFKGVGLGRSLQAEESDWGVTYTFTRPDGRRRVQQFGMPNVFYMTALPSEPDLDWQESLFWWVPIDDERHMQFSLHRLPVTGENAERFKERRERQRATIDLAHQQVCEQILGGMVTLAEVDRQRVDMVRLQDDIAQVGQGRVADRNTEHLGRADVGLSLVRRIMRRELLAQAEGRPLKDWKHTAGLVPTVWQLDDAAAEKPLATIEQGADAEIIDIRPHVEVAIQLKALHGVLSAGK